MGIRVVKTAFATMIAIYLADLFHLNQALYAGILAIIGIEVTKKKSLQSTLERFLASALSLIPATLLFFIFGFHIWVLGVFILLAYPILAKVNLKDGIVTGTVVVYHLFQEETLSLQIFWNEILLLVIGLGSATLINLLYMPDDTRLLEEKKNLVEDLFSRIFAEISCHLKDSRHIWDGKEILQAQDAIKQGLSLANRSLENRLFKNVDEDVWQSYFVLRSKQLDSIQRMLKFVAQIYQTNMNGEKTAELFDDLSEFVKRDVYTGKVERKLAELEKELKEMPLPASRDEFEIRSAILQICLELKYCLSIAKKLKKPKREEKRRKNFLSL